MGGELSGGMKRKLSTAIALCGGSKFVILDEVRTQADDGLSRAFTKALPGSALLMCVLGPTPLSLAHL